MRSNQYNPTQAGYETLKAADTFRKILMAKIDPFLSLEAKIEAKIKIRAMDHNELRASVIALNK